MSDLTTCPRCWRTTPTTDLCEHDDIDTGPLCIGDCCQREHGDWKESAA